MKILNIGSGSKGNVTYIEYGDTSILIDCGLSLKRVTETLRKHSIDRPIDGILITHEHSDHVAHMIRIMNKFHTDIFISKKSFNNLPQYIKAYIDIDRVFFIENESKYMIKDITFVPISLYHDTVNIFGFLLKLGSNSYGYLTDTGIIPEKYFPLLKQMNYLMIESNHDVEMLMQSNREYTLKQRILSDYGHLSNVQCSEILEKIVNQNTRVIMLSHLSEECNTEELALKINQDTLDKIGSKCTLLALRQMEDTMVECDD